MTDEDDNANSKEDGGVTIDHKNVIMNEKDDTKQNRIHEIFHTLFFDQDGSEKGIGHYPPKKINQSAINNLINNTQLPTSN